MKTIIIKLFLLLIFICFLAFPSIVLTGATEGLLMWYQIILPTLLPFLILTSLIIKTNAFDIITQFLSPTIRRIFRTSTQGSFAIIIGFLCGYPCGAKTIRDLYQERNITKNEAQYLLSFCNNTSPMFLVSFMIHQILCDISLLFPSLLAIYGAPIIMSFFTRKIYLGNTDANAYPGCKETRKFSIHMLDESMIDSFTLITKIGCYIMIFSILVNLLTLFNHMQILPFDYFLPLLEITNGIILIDSYAHLSFHIRYLCIIFLVSFGGFCAIAQTQCVLEGSDIRISPYFTQKIITATIAVIISLIIY